MRTVRGIECYEQRDLCQNTNIADAVKAANKLIVDNCVEVVGGFAIDFIPEGKRKGTSLIILPVSQLQSSQAIQEVIEVFKNYGVRVHYIGD